MLWSFIAVFFSGWLYVDSSYRGPVWQRWVFKPVTVLLLLLLALQAPLSEVTGYLIIAGLLASLLADTLTLLPRQRLLYAYGAYFLSHLLYSLYFISHTNIDYDWQLPLVLIIIGVVAISIIWAPLAELRMPVLALVGITLLMVWLAGSNYFSRHSDASFSEFLGAGLLLLGNLVWLISKYRHRFPADSAIVAACYFGGHFLIVRSLYI
ncbi:lysoplasmalogenase [Citrobacter sp. JGM124]|uniref:lysoplasmalogenase n=1 Tax=Citrobacter sp. JGM124 TaxID=2799789 RepID=UPI001BAB22EE|nr:lysoplasmalogenase [Citrobacter sp. JGM124]MBS0848212.1 lysoplasmalogenase [Citrobacter sp. JGM124]